SSCRPARIASRKFCSDMDTLRCHLAGYCSGHWPGRGKSKLSGLLSKLARLALDDCDVFVGYDFSALELAGEAGDGIFFFPFSQFRQLAVLRRITFVMAA